MVSFLNMALNRYQDKFKEACDTSRRETLVSPVFTDTEMEPTEVSAAFTPHFSINIRSDTKQSPNDYNDVPNTIFVQKMSQDKRSHDSRQDGRKRHANYDPRDDYGYYGPKKEKGTYRDSTTATTATTSTTSSRSHSHNSRRSRSRSPTTSEMMKILKSIQKTQETHEEHFKSIQKTQESMLETQETHKEHFKSIEGTINKMHTSMYPHQDKFYSKLCVKQCKSVGLEDKRAPTWSLMKIVDDNKDWCVGITSAHLLSRYCHAAGETKFFIELPYSFCKVGVKHVFLHKALLDATPNYDINSIDIMVVVLNGIPEIDGKKSQMKDLVPYPKDATSYDDSWQYKKVTGRSSLDFVSGVRVLQTECKIRKLPFFIFHEEESEKGDSGTLMFINQESDGVVDAKILVGVFKGTKCGKDRRNRGLITPAIGWSKLHRTTPMVQQKGQSSKNSPTAPQTGQTILVSVRSKELVSAQSEESVYETKYIDTEYKFSKTIGLGMGAYKLTSSNSNGNGKRQTSLYGTIIGVEREMNSQFRGGYEAASDDECDSGEE